MLDPARFDDELVPEQVFDREPEYLIVGGLIFHRGMRSDVITEQGEVRTPDAEPEHTTGKKFLVGEWSLHS